ncbi:M48 family metallopeptidase [Leptospira sp. 2 VSF19]|uniref:M48 family metallopeptidase n=1 Tax=Leptospira soteropolitanensis TaxID=2950025 RepID=A0AAW5VBV3_9LEPT|nr:SprT family zinc-dependent metalloprotease [Leptospira soteropolitanensis]MCW7492726.1 M48 family metallopeptidase [Leptospira soteropolitanensis]MCW7500409.1 M48 family metallopeptidase [Leptospira soteropolitanensis]MCW7522556.1 M48 family metallopeptidase [Leptospira soteropolitanensis]MCW7526412.1 M48 family metallopeptidase [Leptospira soteropolitanensis]MCW7530379.1 M48 family metallopeptidase [Leptospira soteropolitanensis]
MIDLTIERKITKGNNISLVVYQNGRVVLKHPAKVPKKQLEDFLSEKKDWIVSKLAQLPKDIPQKLKFEDGEKTYIFGNPTTVSIIPKKKYIYLNGTIQIPNTKTADSRIRKGKQVLKELLLEKVLPLIEKTSLALNTKVTKISIKTMRSLWGSCNSKNQISLNLSLVHCPDYIIEYIILHEIAHTIEHNHSSKFWKIVKSQDPNYKVAEKWLKDVGKKYIYYLN